MPDSQYLSSATAASSQPISASSAQAAPPSGPLSHMPRIRRRNRTIASCLECRRRKLKCDKQAPCTNCTRFRRDCLYLASSLDSVSQQKLAEIKDKMETLEQTLEQDFARRKSSTGPPSAHVTKMEDLDSDDEDVVEPEDERLLEPTALAAFDQVYEDDADDELMDLGIQLGKLRVSERIGGFVRPKMAEELRAVVGDVPSFPNQTSPPPLGRSASFHPSASPAAYLGPGPEFLAPASNFFFPGTTYLSLAEYLPSRGLCDELMTRYWAAVHPIARTVHRPSFERQYGSFWDHVSIGAEPPPSVQAIMFAAMFSAAVSLSESQVLQQYAMTKQSLVEMFQTNTEVSLSRANFLRTTKLDTMQAFVMYLIPLCRAEISRAHSALTGTAIRLAECMGLHRDGSIYGMTPVETHVRRLVWYQLCFLDIRTCEATGPRPQIRKEDFDTKLPLNRNDDDLLETPGPLDDAPYFTELTPSLMRFECFELYRQLWIDMPRIDQKKLTLTVVLGKIQKFRVAMEKKYAPSLQGQAPQQLLAGHMYRILSNRPFIMLLHRYLMGTQQQIPDRLRKLVIDASIVTNEASVALDTRPEVAPWSWYRGAFNQFHSAMIIMFHVQARPDCAEASRIWRLMDYIFEQPAHLPPEEKISGILTALRDRICVYQSMRRMRATTRAQIKIDQFHDEQRDGSRVFSRIPDASGAAARELEQRLAEVPASLVPQMFTSPAPLRMASDDGSGGQAVHHPTGAGTSPVDAQMQAIDDIDWNEWDKYFPPDSPSFGHYDLPEFDMGSFNPFPASHLQLS